MTSWFEQELLRTGASVWHLILLKNEIIRTVLGEQLWNRLCQNDLLRDPFTCLGVNKQFWILKPDGQYVLNLLRKIYLKKSLRCPWRLSKDSQNSFEFQGSLLSSLSTNFSYLLKAYSLLSRIRSPGPLDLSDCCQASSAVLTRCYQ